MESNIGFLWTMSTCAFSTTTVQSLFPAASSISYLRAHSRFLRQEIATAISSRAAYGRWYKWLRRQLSVIGCLFKSMSYLSILLFSPFLYDTRFLYFYCDLCRAGCCGPQYHGLAHNNLQVIRNHASRSAPARLWQVVQASSHCPRYCPSAEGK